MCLKKLGVFISQLNDPSMFIFHSSTVYPLVIAAHPQEPHQFAIGLTDGSVIVFEPLESEGKWGLHPNVETRPASAIGIPPPNPPIIALDQPRSLE